MGRLLHSKGEKIMRKALGKNLFISIYVLMYLMYAKLNSKIYMNLLVDISTIFLTLSIVSILYSIIFRDRFIKIFYTANIFIIFVFLSLVVFLKPTYTYNQAKEIIESKIDTSEKIINCELPSSNILLSKPKKNILVIGNYRFYIETKDNTHCYEFDSMNGNISLNSKYSQ